MTDVYFLIGYRAVGKTTIGRLLAEELGLQFLDTDKLVEQQSGKTIAELVEKAGWDGFREAEKLVLQQTAGMNNVLVSTGGGAVVHGDVWHEIKKYSRVIWLSAEPEVILSRLRLDDNTSSQRPPLSGKGVFAEIETILNERLPLYSALADVTIDTGKMTVEEVVTVLGRWCRDNTIQSGEK